MTRVQKELIFQDRHTQQHTHWHYIKIMTITIIDREAQEGAAHARLSFNYGNATKTGRRVGRGRRGRGGPFETKDENTQHNNDEKRGGEKVMLKCEHHQLCLSFLVCLLQNSLYGTFIVCQKLIYFHCVSYILCSLAVDLDISQYQKQRFNIWLVLKKQCFYIWVLL